MRYKSTRGGGGTAATSSQQEEEYYSFEEALFSGYAPDGGLFVPVSLTSIIIRGEKNNEKEHDQYLLWSKMTFPELAFDILVS